MTGAPSRYTCTRRQLLMRATHGGVALGALAALAAPPPAAESAESPENGSAGAAATEVTDFERSCLRFRIDTTRNRLIAIA